ncbi:MAG: hypothetical protein WCG25_04915 [bacterium]
MSNSITTFGVTQFLSIFFHSGEYRFHTVYFNVAPSSKSFIVCIDHLPNV